MGNFLNQPKKFGDPGYTIPEMEYLQSMESPGSLQSGITPDQEEESDVPLLPEKPITDQMREALLSAPDPIEKNAAMALEALKQGPQSVDVPESMRPRTVKGNLKNILLGAIPLYGPAYTASRMQNRAYDKLVYDAEVSRQKEVWEAKKSAAMKWHDAKIKQDQEVSTRQAKIKLLLSIYGNVPPSYIMKAAGVTIPTSKQVKMEPVMVRKYLKDGKTIGNPEMAVYNPAMGVFTVTDPDTGEDVTIPRNLIASAQKMGTAGSESDPYGTRLRSMEQALGRPATEQEKLKIFGADDGSTGGSADERMAWTAAQQRFTGNETPQEQQAIYLDEFKKLKMMVPGFTSAAATERASLSQLNSMWRTYVNSPVARRYTAASEAINFASKINPKSQNPADHQAMIYAFAKAMDPESVVREGEYKTVQKYSQAWKDAVGLDLQRIIDNKGILTPQAIANMQRTMRAKLSSMKDSLEVLRSEVGARMDAVSGESGNADLLPTFDSSSVNGSSSSNPNLRVRKDRTTGKIEHSLDGGKTWKKGEPKR